ncbi:unnamed protein product, partial [marine sediment metagenome]
MKKLLVIMSLVLVVFCASNLCYAGEVKQGDKITIVEPGTVARLCPYPDCGQDQHITRIPKGTILTVEGIMDVKSGRLPPVKWFEVTYKGKRGWT